MVGEEFSGPALGDALIMLHSGVLGFSEVSGSMTNSAVGERGPVGKVELPRMSSFPPWSESVKGSKDETDEEQEDDERDSFPSTIGSPS